MSPARREAGSEEPADGASGAGNEPSLEARLRRLDEIVAQLEGGDPDLETGLRLFEEGVRHIREAEGLLAEAQLRVEELVGNAEAAEVRSVDLPVEKDEA